MISPSCAVKVVEIRSNATSIFQLEKGWHENILGPLMFNTEPSNPTVEVSQAEEDKSPNLGLSCQACGIESFPNLEEQRDHYRSDHHRMNIHRRLKKLPPFSLPEFEQLLEKFSGLSEDEDESDIEDIFSHLEIESSDQEPVLLSKEQKDLMASPVLWLQLKDPASSLLGIYRSLIPDVNKGWGAVESDLAVHKAGKWALILIGGGHFVAAIFDNSRFDLKNNKPCVVASKTFHRYTVRRKQGGAQSGNDNSKGKAKSAGATIRRQMETMLREDVRELLTSWNEALDTCCRLYVRAPSANQKIIHPNPAFAPNDPRVFSFPFATKRPTLREAQRCYLELIHPKDAKLEVAPASAPRPVPKAKSDVEPLKKAAIPSKPKAQKERPRPPRVSEFNAESNDRPDPLALDMIDSIVTWFQTADPSHQSSYQELLAKIQDCEFLKATPNYRIKGLPGKPTVLHVACQYGQAKLIASLLEIGCDPTLTLSVDSTPRTPFQLSLNKSTKMQFRLYRFHHPDQHDWEKASVPPPISPEDFEAKHTSQKLKKKEKPKKKPLPPHEPSPPPRTSKSDIYSSIARGFEASKRTPPAPGFSGFGAIRPKPKSEKPLGSGFGAAKPPSVPTVGWGVGRFLTDGSPPDS
ncbi:hypothetical protein DSO57_1023521 [Entomophthora muscae]|uniref:Uncharacterized protein n=1 Tax=Entomophthora muscae TaxID=34485 RepID=A0ACC2UBX5_9FUNG|nr:hypothetical protein DSO57_1023521 [Entomophthora muscae]